MKTFITFMIAALFALPTMANSDMAKKTLSQSTTNPFCASGDNSPNPYERSSYERPDPAKSICEGRDVIDCYRDLYKKQ